MQHAMAAGHLPSSLVPNSLPGHGGYSPGQLGGGGGGRSPVASPTPQPPGLTGPGAGGGAGLMPGYGGGLTPGNSSHNTSGTDLIFLSSMASKPINIRWIGTGSQPYSILCSIVLKTIFHDYYNQKS